MRRRQIEGSPIVGPFGDPGHPDDLHDLRLSDVPEHGEREHQPHLLVHRDQAPSVDVGDVAHDTGAQLLAAPHLPEHREVVLPGFLRRLLLVVGRCSAVLPSLALVGERSHPAVILDDRLVVGVRDPQHLVAGNALSWLQRLDEAGPRLRHVGAQRPVSRVNHQMIDLGHLALGDLQARAQNGRLPVLLDDSQETDLSGDGVGGEYAELARPSRRALPQPRADRSHLRVLHELHVAREWYTGRVVARQGGEVLLHQGDQRPPVQLLGT